MKTRELEAKLAEAKATQARVAQEQALLREQRETARAREECESLKQRLDAHQLIEEKLKDQVGRISYLFLFQFDESLYYFSNRTSHF